LLSHYALVPHNYVSWQNFFVDKEKLKIKFLLHAYVLTSNNKEVAEIYNYALQMHKDYIDF